MPLEKPATESPAKRGLVQPAVDPETDADQGAGRHGASITPIRAGGVGATSSSCGGKDPMPWSRARSVGGRVGRLRSPRDRRLRQPVLGPRPDGQDGLGEELGVGGRRCWGSGSRARGSRRAGSSGAAQPLHDLPTSGRPFAAAVATSVAAAV